MSTWALVILILSNYNGVSGGSVSIPGYTSPAACEYQAKKLNQMPVDSGARRFQTMCVEVN